MTTDRAESVKRPASQYYWGDWWKDKGLQSCSQPARGLWHEMNTLMHEGEPYGHLTVNGKPMTIAQLANLCRITPAKCKAMVDELLAAGVPSVDPATGALYSRRMVRDEVVRNARAAGGKAGAEHGIKGAEAGKKGGRPVYQEGGSETPLSGGEKPPPSSSSSSSPSGNPPSLRSGGAGANPRRTRRGSEAITLTVYLERCRTEEKKPIPADHFVRNDCRDVGITDEMLQVAWIVFRRKYTEDEKFKGKRYSDWPRHFANAVNGRWGGLWFIDPATNQAQWSSTGLQQKAILDARARAREQEHAT